MSWRWRAPDRPRVVSVLVLPVGLALLGAVQTAAFVRTGWWIVPWLTTAALVSALARATPRRAFWLGWCYAGGWLLAGVWWLFVSMHRYGGLAAPLAALAVFVLAAVLSLYLGLAAWAWARWRRASPATDALLWAALWLLAEVARGWIFTGFPWLASGYAQIDGPLAPLLPWVGVYGVGAAAAWVAALLAAIATATTTSITTANAAPGLQAPWRTAALTGLALAAAGVFPAAGFTRGAGTLQVALLQPNVPQDEKFMMQRMPATLAWLASALMEARAALVVAPETAMPLLPAQLEDFAPGYWQHLSAHFTDPAAGRALLIGRPLGDFDRGYTNSVSGLAGRPASSAARAAGAAEYRYDKNHLVPFGEFIPTGFRWFTDTMAIPLGDFERGPPKPQPFIAAGQRIAPHICYEDLFGEELARRFDDPDQAPTILANLSNIGWFGDTIAVAQHLNISRARALEFQRPVVRATNTGATAAIAHDGRVLGLLEPFTRGRLDARVEGRVGLTPFARWASAAGLWPLVLPALAVVGLAAARRRRVARTAGP